MNFDKKETPAPKSPADFFGHIHAQEAREDKELLTRIVLFYLVEGGNDWCNDEQHRRDVHILWMIFTDILDWQEAHLPAQRIQAE